MMQEGERLFVIDKEEVKEEMLTAQREENEP